MVNYRNLPPSSADQSLNLRRICPIETVFTHLIVPEAALAGIAYPPVAPFVVRSGWLRGPLAGWARTGWIGWCGLVCFLAVGTRSATAQLPTTVITPVTAQVGDPYATSAGGGGLFATVAGGSGGQVVHAPYVGDLDPYAVTSPQLNPPIVNPPVVAAPQRRSSMFGTPLFQPLLPGLESNLPSRLYFRGDYLLWDVSGMNLPALVTTSPPGTPQPQAGVLGESGTNVLFGGNSINDGSTNGWLFAGGLWITPQRNLAIEAEYIGLSDHNDRYNGSSDGSVILARPFFDIVSGDETSQLISFPGVVGGNLSINSESDFRSYLINARVSLCPAHSPACQLCGQRDRTDWIIGYRNIRLRDSLTANEQLTSQLTAVPPGTVSLVDQFQTTNQFDGLQLGVVHRMLLNRAWLESSLRVALGNNEQTLRVGGGTTIDQSGVVNQYDTGLLAQRTNSGVFRKDEFMLVPEIGLRLGVRLTQRLHATVGYSVLYLPNVIRAGEQIDTDINPGLLAPETVPLNGALRPQPQWVQTDYLAHGLHFGGELQF